MDAREIEGDERIKEAERRAKKYGWARGHLEVKVGEDEAGPWWEYAQSGLDVQWCTTKTKRGTICQNRAGAGTGHLGAGPCFLHGGAGENGEQVGAWIVAHGFARALEVTPWDGLLMAVRIAAGRVAWIEAKLATAEYDRQLEPPHGESISEAGRGFDEGGTNLHFWVKQAELWHDRLARVSKLAIDAGVAERLVRQLELEADLMLRATTLTFDELGLGVDVRERALGIMSRNLLALEAEEIGAGGIGNAIMEH
jgi:hypothetical protein